LETPAHATLKMLAVRFLRSSGCRAVALEVSCPISRYRLDVAGYGDRAPRCTVIIECKQSRGDFLRDQEHVEVLAARRRDLAALREAMERKRLMVEEPHLRRGSGSLFPELDDWDFSAARSPGYRRLLAELCRLDRRLYGHTKFCRMAHWALADRLYLAAPRGVIKPREVPEGWGLLESGRDGGLTVAAPAPALRCRELHRQRLLGNIAVSASSAAFPLVP
jgi:hypothetical protein